MRKKMSKKAIAIALVATVILGGAGAAFAYWTTTGSGTGQATAGTVAEITAVQTSTVSGMGPAIEAQELSGVFSNYTAGADTGTAYVTTVTASIDGVYANAAALATGTKLTVETGCSAADFILSNPVMDVKADVSAGEAVGAWGKLSSTADVATIMFDNTTSNQDLCKSVIVTIKYVVA